MENIFNAVIAVIDRATGPMQVIARRMQSIGGQISAIRLAPSGSSRAAALQALGSVKSGLQRIEQSAFSAVGALGSLFPALAGLGAAGSLVGLVGISRRTAESAVQSARLAEKLGISTAQLGMFRAAAKETGIDADAMAGSIGKLQVVMVKAATGKAGNIGIIFKRAGIDLQAAVKSGDITGVMAKLADAFAKTTNPIVKEAAAVALFGKQGKELLPVLNQGSAAFLRMAQDARELGPNLQALDKVNLEQLRLSSTRLDMAIGGLTSAIGAGLAPILTPVQDQITNFIKAHRAEIVSYFTSKVQTLVTVVKNVIALDWDKATSSPIEFGKAFWGATAGVHGLIAVIGGMMLIIGSPLIGALTNVGAAAASMGRVIMFSAKVMVIAGRAMLFTPWGRIIALIMLVATAAYYIYENWKDVKKFFWDTCTSIGEYFEVLWKKVEPIFTKIQNAVNFVRQHLTIMPAADAAPGVSEQNGPIDEVNQYATPAPVNVPARGDRTGTSAPDNLPNPFNFSRPGGRPGLQPQQQGQVDLHISFDNLPAGARVDTRTRGQLGDVQLDTGDMAAARGLREMALN